VAPPLRRAEGRRRATSHALGVGLVFAALLASPAARAEDSLRAGPQGPETGPYREQAWRIPIRDAGGIGVRLIEANLYQPPGDRRRPLVILNHGTSRIFSERQRLRPDWGLRLTVFFLGEGYAVVTPLRRGYGRSPGDPDERVSGCVDPDYADAGRRVARQIREVADYLAQQRFVMPGRTVVAGQSAGAFASLALGGANPPGILAIVNFAGGRGSISDQNICGENRLVAAFGEFGRTARLPTIWLYARNDRFFWPALVDRFHRAYTEAGGRADLHYVPEFGRDGHGFHRLAAAEPHWQPLVRDFLRRLNTGAAPATTIPSLPERAPSGAGGEPREGRVRPSP
jgi:dienelactone hydrolase